MAKEKKQKAPKEKEKKVKYTGRTSYDLGTVLIFCAFAGIREISESKFLYSESEMVPRSFPSLIASK